MSNSEKIIKLINQSLSTIEDEFAISDILDDIASIINSAIKRNLDEGATYNPSFKGQELFGAGSKEWEPLAESTKKSYERSELGITKLLNRTGNLRTNIETGVKGNKIYIASNAPYSRFHQFGTSSIPARPFIVLTQEDMEEIYQVILESLG